jgi:hypothetical protein
MVALPCLPRTLRTHRPHNVKPARPAECAYDGGDCCNAKAPFYDCRDPKSPLFGKASPRGLRLPAPRNPRYTEGMGRVLSTKQLVTTYNNFYE